MDQPMTLWQLLSQAGWTMVPLYLCSIAGLTLLLRKLAQFRSARVTDFGALDALSEEVEDDRLGELAESWSGLGTPLGRVLAVAARALQRHPRRAEEEASRAAVAELAALEYGLGALAFIAQVAPLFGLLGTVLGMVDLFSGMEAAGDAVDTGTLSSGIWKALLTTAAGLMVAIPALGGHAWLGSRLDTLRLKMEDGIGRLLDPALGRQEAS